MKFTPSLILLFSCALPCHLAPITAGLDISNTLQNILDNTDGSDAYTYPTDLTRGIVPVSTISANFLSQLTGLAETNPLPQ